MHSMTSRERMLKAMRNDQPDRIPVAPDMSCMIPCRLTGKPFWDILLYQNPPLWRAYADAVEYFGMDGWLYSLNGFYLEDPAQMDFEDDNVITERVIVERTDDRIVTRNFTHRKGQSKEWDDYVTVFPRFDPQTTLLASKIGLAKVPDKWWPIESVKPQKKGFDLLKEAKDYFNDGGVIGIFLPPPMLANPALENGYSVYDYYDEYDRVKEWSIRSHEQIMAYLKRILNGPVRPDFILTGGSGMLVFSTPEIIRDISLPTLKEITRICKEAGIPSQVHCCGPEREMVRMCAQETDLSSINPLEIPPMGDCELSEIKRSFGGKLGLMGNLHTTNVMLHGSTKDVRRESLKAILAAGEGGGFILSTGDQCGRDTPEENIREMVRVAEEFGHYPLDMAVIEREIKLLGE